MPAFLALTALLVAWRQFPEPGHLEAVSPELSPASLVAFAASAQALSLIPLAGLWRQEWA